MNVIQRTKAFLLDGQYGHPTGIIGYLLGEQMVLQHRGETAWTISLLDIKADDHILELGFGAGRAIELAATQAVNGHVAGIEHSQTMVRSASYRNAKAIKAGRVTLYQGDLNTLLFADSQFDKVFSIQTLYFWSNPQHILAEIFRVLKDGASFVVVLSTGKVDAIEPTGLEQYQQLLEEQIVPDMKQLGFTQAYIAQGPIFRQFRTTAVIGVK